MVVAQARQVDAEIADLAREITDDVFRRFDIVEHRAFDQPRTHIIGRVGLVGKVDGIVGFVFGAGDVELDHADLLIQPGKLDRRGLFSGDIAAAREGHTTDSSVLDIQRGFLIAALPQMEAVEIEADGFDQYDEQHRLRHKADEFGKALLLDTLG